LQLQQGNPTEPGDSLVSPTCSSSHSEHGGPFDKGYGKRCLFPLSKTSFFHGKPEI